MSTNAIIKPYMNSEEFIRKNGSVDYTNNQPMGNNKLVNLMAGSDPTDSINKGQMDGGLSLKSDVHNHPYSLDTHGHTHSSLTGVDGDGSYHLSSGQQSGLVDGNNTILHQHTRYVEDTDMTYERSGYNGWQRFPNGVIMAYGQTPPYDVNDFEKHHITGWINFHASFPNAVINTNITISQGGQYGYEEAEISSGVYNRNAGGFDIGYMRWHGNNGGSVSGTPPNETWNGPERVFWNYIAIGY